MCIFLFPYRYLQRQYLLFKSLKTVLLYVMKSNSCILLYSKLQLFHFLFLIYKKKHLGLMDHPLVLRNPSLMSVKTNGIFKTVLLSNQCWLLRLVGIDSIQYLTKARSYWLKLTNMFHVVSSLSLRTFSRHLTDI